MKEKISIILLTSNRKDFSKKTIDGFYERLVNTQFIHLIVIDNNSQDGTVEMLKEYEANGKIQKLILLGEGETVNISNAYNLGFKYVESEYFVTGQDDIIIPKLEPDVVEQLISLMEKYPDVGSIACLIQRVPNLQTDTSNEDLISARKALSSYFRIQRKSDFEKMGDNPFSTRDWDDIGTLNNIREKLKKEGYWAKNLYCNHLGYTTDNRGYPSGYKRMWGWNNRKSDNKRKPYPEIDPLTNVPLPNQKLFR
jgi:GT2 family glycosyltransferase